MIFLWRGIQGIYKTLRYFVDIQEPKFNVIHIIAGYDNKYILLDENKQEITNECLQEFMNDLPEEKSIMMIH